MPELPVTVVIPVKNEEQNLKNCLPKLEVFDQVIVVDSSSTDSTREVTESFTFPEYHNFVWDGTYPKKRNWALDHLKIHNEWVLFLDADEQITESFISEIHEKIPGSENNGFWITYENYFMGKRLTYGDKMKKLALFKKELGRYEKIEEELWTDLDMEVHEHPIVKGSVGALRSPVIHHDFNSLEQYIARHNSYSTWEAKRFFSVRNENEDHLTFRQKIKYWLMNTLLLSWFYFLYSYVLRLGFLDGKAGLYFAIYKANYFFQIHTKIEELKRSRS